MNIFKEKKSWEYLKQVNYLDEHEPEKKEKKIIK